MRLSLVRGIVLLILSAVLAVATSAQQPPSARPEDVASVGAIIAASYAALTRPPGKAPDLQRFESLFRSGAQLINLSDVDGKPSARAGTIEQVTQMLQSTQHQERGHFEKEIARRSEQYRNIAHVWSTFISAESAHSDHFARGINSISLIKDGGRWWIVSAQWTNETQAHQIPKRQLNR